jgi:Right handed beta helix region
VTVRRVGVRLGRRKVMVTAAILALALLCSVVAVALVDAGNVQEPGSAPETAATWPATPPARICGNQSVLGGGPAEPAEGDVVVPAGDNEAMGDTLRAEDKVFWFEPGVHTLGRDEFAQIAPGSGSVYVGAPGAVIDGQHVNRYAFTGEAVNVTIRYLTIQNFVAPMNEGTVNHNDGSGWLVEYSTITRNKGAGLMAGAANNTYRYNCISENGQYGVNACCGTEDQPVQNLVLDHNEITGNNTDDWEGSTGAAAAPEA